MFTHTYLSYEESNILNRTFMFMLMMMMMDQHHFFRCNKRKEKGNLKKKTLSFRFLFFKS